jgi:hypothetical protein
MFKKILIIILTGALMFSVSGCKGSYAKCFEVEEKEPHNIIYVELPYYDEDTLFKDSDLIFKGTVLEAKEIGIEEYIDGRLARTHYRDVFTFEIEKIYYSEDPSLEAGDVIRVANGSCSNEWVTGTLKMEENKKYIVLTEKEYNYLRYVDFTEYDDYYTADYWVSIIPVVDGKYYVDIQLPSLTDNAEEEIIREDINFKTKIYVKGAGFEDELEALILEKKGES